MGNRTLARLAAAAAGGVLALTAAAPAMAADPVQIPLKANHAGQTAVSGDWPTKCGAGEFNDVEIPDGYDGWHFVVPSAGGNNKVAFVSLTLTFDGGVVTIDDFDPSDGRWIREDKPKHAFLFAPAGWTLESGVAEVADGNPEQFNVSHACPGTPDDGDTPGGGGEEPGDNEPGDNEPGDNEGEEPGDNEDEEADENQEEALPTTGSATTRLLGIGALLVTAGGVMAGGVGFLAMRRRRLLSNLADEE